MYQVMVVDDEREVVDTLERYISEAGLGFSVVAKASNGKDALRLLEVATFDLLITDIKMPVIDGLTLLRRAKARGWDGYAVLVSGYDEFEYAQQAIRLSVHDYLLKPIFPDTVVELLKSIRESDAKEGAPAGPVTGPTPASSPDPGLLAASFLPDYITRAQEYILEHYPRPLSLTEVAQHVGVSPGYLSAQFSKWCAQSFVEYVTDLRLKKAKELLTRTSLPVQTIVEMVGYNDPCYFARVFRKATGQSPGSYRKTLWETARRGSRWSLRGTPGTPG